MDCLHSVADKIVEGLHKVSFSVSHTHFKISSSCGFFSSLQCITGGNSFAYSVHVTIKDIYFDCFLSSVRKLHLPLIRSTFFLSKLLLQQDHL